MAVALNEYLEPNVGLRSSVDLAVVEVTSLLVSGRRTYADLIAKPLIKAAAS
jgi:hypothetical protein